MRSVQGQAVRARVERIVETATTMGVRPPSHRSRTQDPTRQRSLALIVGLLLAAFSARALADQLVEVTAHTLNVRAAPSIDAPIVGVVHDGDELLVTPVSNTWAEILHGSRVGGFVSRNYVRPIERPTPYADRPAFRGVPFAATLFVVLFVCGALALLLRKQTKSGARDISPGGARRERTRAHTAPSRTQPGLSASWKSSSRHSKRDGDEKESARFRIEAFPMAKVHYVIDGDTVIVSRAWKRTKVRLDSIDCPEDGQPWGDVATAGLIKMIGGQRVRLEEHGEDHHGRLLATIYVQDKRSSEWLNVNEKMVVKGHAWVMQKYIEHLPEERRYTFTRLERWAKRKKVGLWGTANPMPPWVWRRQSEGRPQGR